MPLRDHHIWTLGRTTTGIENSTVVLRCQHAMPQRLHLFDSLLRPKFTPMNVINAGVDTPIALKLINSGLERQYRLRIEKLIDRWKLLGRKKILGLTLKSKSNSSLFILLPNERGQD